MARIPGVIKTEVGYIGGHVENPTYQDVCTKQSGHIEAVRITYDRTKIGYKDLAMIFFEKHNFAQEDGQGPDIGPQYLSRVFTEDQEEISILEGLMDILQRIHMLQRKF